VRKASLIVALMVAAPAAADDAAEAAAHAAVREALLERATLPEHRPEHDQASAQVAHEHLARARQEEAERAAHSRAAAHGARQTRDAHPEHGDRSWMRGGSSTMSGSGMDSGWDCHDPAENDRTRGMHDDWMPPDREPHWR
jgi:hypothetical protein